MISMSLRGEGKGREERRRGGWVGSWIKGGRYVFFWSVGRLFLKWMDGLIEVGKGRDMR